MIDNQLLMGIVLIAAGLAIGLLAYALVLNRREATRDREAPAVSPSMMDGEAETDEGQNEAQAEREPVEAEPDDETIPDAVEGEADEEREPEPPTALEDRLADEAYPVSPSLPEPDISGEARAPSPGPRRALATLMRDEKTGKLALIIGEREYVDASELKGTDDWARLEQASRDLATWLNEAQPTEPDPTSRVKKARQQTKSIVDEVNEILERKLSDSGLTQRGVRLSQDSQGSVRVYIGIQSYTMEEIPDPEIRELIREAVNEWEGSS